MVNYFRLEINYKNNTIATLCCLYATAEGKMLQETVKCYTSFFILWCELLFRHGYQLLLSRNAHFLSHTVLSAYRLSLMFDVTHQLPSRYLCYLLNLSRRLWIWSPIRGRIRREIAVFRFYFSLQFSLFDKYSHRRAVFRIDRDEFTNYSLFDHFD